MNVQGSFMVDKRMSCLVFSKKHSSKHLKGSASLPCLGRVFYGAGTIVFNDEKTRRSPCSFPPGIVTWPHTRIHLGVIESRVDYKAIELTTLQIDG